MNSYSDQSNHLHIDVVQSADAFALMHGTWNRLLEQTAANAYFLRWEWLWTWWNVYRREQDTLCIITCYRGNVLIGIAPFYIHLTHWNGLIPLRRLMLLGSRERGVTSEYLDIICRPEDEKAFGAKIIDMIAHDNICDDAALNTVSNSSPLVTVLRKQSAEAGLLYRTEARYSCPYIPLPHNYDRFTESLSRSLRTKITSNYRRLDTHSGVSFRRTCSLGELQGDFRELVRLHQVRWESRGLRGSFADPLFSLFHRRMMPEMFRNGHLDLRFLHAGKKAIAALYNIRYNNKVYFYQSGVDTSFDKRMAPGILLHDHAIRDAIGSGAREYDFMLMGTSDEYKLRWTQESRTLCSLYVARSSHLKLIKRVEDRARGYYRGFKSALSEA